MSNKRRVPRAMQVHSMGALLTVACAAMSYAMTLGGELINPGARAAVFLGGTIVVALFVAQQARDAMIAAYTAAFCLSFALFALLGV